MEPPLIANNGERQRGNPLPYHDLSLVLLGRFMKFDDVTVWISNKEENRPVRQPCVRDGTLELSGLFVFWVFIQWRQWYEPH